MRRAGVCALALLCATALAADSADLAFLEFLGSFSDDEGEWLDPLALEEAASIIEAATLDGDETDPTPRDAADETNDDKMSNEQNTHGDI